MYVCQGEIIGTWGKYWSKWHLWILIICKSGKMVLKVRFWGIPPKLSERLIFSKTGKGESVHLLRNKNKHCLAIHFHLCIPFCGKGIIFNIFLGVVVSYIFECLWHSERRAAVNSQTRPQTDLVVTLSIFSVKTLQVSVTRSLQAKFHYLSNCSHSQLFCLHQSCEHPSQEPGHCYIIWGLRIL